MEAFRSPTRKDLARLTRRHGPLRAVNDPRTDDVWVWPAGDMLHEADSRELRLSDMTTNLGTVHGPQDHDRLDRRSHLSAPDRPGRR
jgi:hypothetical protein